MKLRKFVSVLLVLAMILTILPTVSAAGVNGYYNVDYLEDYASAAYTEEDLGASWTSSATTFKVWSPTAKRVQVRLFKTGSDEEEGAGVIGTYSMAKDETTGVWSVKLDGDYKNVYYTYLVTNRGKTCETRDVYAKASGVNGYRSMVVDLDETDPSGWAEDKHVLREESTDAVIWEIHVRDFSISPSSGVSEADRGKYLAFTEDNTTLDGKVGEVSTCVSYLKEMGVNTVHLLPVYDFGSVDETVTDDPTNRNWGYDPINYNVPEGSYSTNPYDGNVRIKEFKQMVQALHEAGISVVMDVVYNHTYDVDSYEWGARLLYNNAFNDTVPGYYFRMANPSGWYNGSGCGNVTASDKLMYRKYMVESVLYWATEYHIDGFRFDLMGCHDVDTMNLIRSELDKLEDGEKILMYGEPWTGGDAGIANGATQSGAAVYDMNERIAMFCDWMRDAIKGNPDGDTTGWIQGNTDQGKTEAIAGGLNANDGRLTARSQTVTYADAHDNLILWDKIVKSNGSSAFTTYTGEAAERYMKQLRLAETILMVAQGLQFQVAGTEFARTKMGDHNSYNSPDNINAIDWNLRKSNKAGADFYKGLIAIRKGFSPFTDPVKQYVQNPLEGADDNCIAFWVGNETPGEWSKLAVILNNSNGVKNVTLPDGDWTILSNGEKADPNGLGSASGSYAVPGFTGVILAQTANRAPIRGAADYYLVGYINKADYYGTDYKFVDGTLTASFTSDTYVFVQDSEGNSYMTDDWQGEVSSVTLYDPDTLEKPDKLMVPVGVEVTFTLQDNGDGTMTLSYTKGGEVPIEPPAPGSSSYYLTGTMAGWGFQEEYRLSDGDNPGEYVLREVSLKKGDGVKVADKDNNVWYPDGMGNELFVSETAKYDVSFYPEGGVTGYYKGFFLLTKVGEADPDPGPGPYTPGDHTGANDKIILHCWNWSFAEIERYLPMIKAAGYTAVQTSPAQPHSGYREGEIGTGDWWMLYQPVGLHVAQEGQSWLGGVEELESLCTAAHEQGIEVIVDVVANHICNSYNDIAADGTDPRAQDQIIATGTNWAGQTVYGYKFETVPSSEVAKYNPELYDALNPTKYFRDYIFVSDEDTEAVVRGNIGMPDFKTEDSVVQTSVLNYLKELIDAGVDGFRFDAAKHIETPNDGEYGSEFWPTIIGGAEEYAESKGKTVWSYGEVLSTAGKTRKMNDYAPYIDMTEISYAYTITEGFGDKKGANAIANQLFKDWLGVGVEELAPTSLVLMAESHDMFADGHTSFSRYGADVINKAWAVAAARADASTLYFARPEGFEYGLNPSDPTAGYPTGTLGKCESTDWMNIEVAEVNKFHTAFVGADEQVYASGNYVVVERIGEEERGAVIVNAEGTGAMLNFATANLTDGEYYDQITGNKLTVSGGKLSGQMGATGIVVLRSTAPVVCEHANTYEKSTEATCTEPAYTMVYCADCGRMLSKTETAPALGHVDADKDDYCDRCGEYLKSVVIYFVDSNDWVSKHDYYSVVNVYAFNESGNQNAAWPGKPAEYIGRSVDSHGIWKVSLDPTKYDTVIFNCGQAQTVNLPFVADAGNAMQVVYTAEVGGTPVDPDKPNESDFYLVGSMSGWEPKPEYRLSEGENEGEFVLEGVSLTANTTLKICTGNKSTWYPDGMGNDYVVEETGTYNVSFYPDGGKGDDYYYGFFRLDLSTKGGMLRDGGAVGATAGAELKEVCADAAYEVVRYYDYEAKICDCCGRHFDVIKVEPDQETMLFTDVSNPDSYYTDPVYWAVASGITAGTSADKFSPSNSCTRAQVVTFLWRAAGEPKPTISENPFKDVKSGQYYYDAVLWAVEKGITAGTSKDKFSPNSSCTRAQIVTFLYRYAGEPEASTSTGFVDVPAKEYYAKPVAWAVQNGITAGTSNTTFSPNDKCTRAQVVTFLFRMASQSE